MIIRLQQGQLIGGFLSPDQFLSFQTIALLGIGLLVLIALWRSFSWIMPSWMKNWFAIRFTPRKKSIVQVDFFRKVSRILEQMGWYRRSSQTYRELTGEAQTWLQTASPTASSGQSLSFLTDVYYRIRYGGKSEISPSEQTRIEQAIQELDAERKNIKPHQEHDE
jgi:hypothetical protein